MNLRSNGPSDYRAVTGIFNSDERITILIIDCRNYSETFMESTSAMERIEELSIELCYSLYVGRLQCTQET
jgi:hypothetical protein